jgi:HK97 family phage portal protein
MVKFRDRIKAFRNPASFTGEVEQRSADDSLRKAFADIGGMSESGISVTQDSAQKFSAVWQAMLIKSILPASLPIEFYEETGSTRKPIEHDAKAVLLKPNALMNRFTWTETMNAWLSGWGNGISIIENRRAGRPESLMPIHPSSVEARYSQGRIFYIIDDRELGIKGTFYSEEILHYRGFTTTGLWGKSPIEVAKDNIGLSLATEKFGSTFFKKGGNLKAVIETDQHLGDKEFVAWSDRFHKSYQGPAGDHETPIFEYGMKYKQLSIPLDASQFIETRQFGIQDVARWFNLPPHMLRDLTRSTFSNIEHQDLEFVKYSLRPDLRRQELELEEKLLFPKEQGRVRIRYNIDGLLRGDLASITQHVKEMVLAGVMTRNEGRRLLNMNPVADGDTLYMPANIVGNNKPQEK